MKVLSYAAQTTLEADNNVQLILSVTFFFWGGGRKSAKIRFWGRKEDNGGKEEDEEEDYDGKGPFFETCSELSLSSRPSPLPKVGWGTEEGKKSRKEDGAKTKRTRLSANSRPSRPFMNICQEIWWVVNGKPTTSFFGGQMTTNSNPFLAYFTLHFWGKELSRAEKSSISYSGTPFFARHPFEPFVTCLSVCPGHLYFQTHYFLFLSRVGRIPSIFFAC